MLYLFRGTALLDEAAAARAEPWASSGGNNS